jgi:peptidoglycan DL-endopeptidase CwlO
MSNEWGIVLWVRIFGEGFRGLRVLPQLVPVAISVLVVTGTAVGVVLAAADGEPSASAPVPAIPIPSQTSVPVRTGAPVVPLLGQPRSAPLSVPVARKITMPAPQHTQPASVAPLRGLRQADILIVASFSLSSRVRAEVSRQPAVTGSEPLEAARVKVNGEYAAVLGVNASTFRGYAAKSVASSNQLWQGVADGGMAVSYSMGTLDKLPLGGAVTVSGRVRERMPVVAFGTVGIAGVDAVVSDSVATSLGMPSDNAMVISAAPQDVAALTTRLQKLVPHGAAVEPLVTWVTSGSGSGASGSGASGSASPVGSAVTGDSLTSAQLRTMLDAALSRRGMPYVWGAAGPNAFDCSGLVQWAFAQAGLPMPRVAADQAMTGPLVSQSQLSAGDLLFYRTDPTDPGYVSHVAIYLGNGWMLQAPQPGMDVEEVPVDLGSEFAGAIQVDPRVAAAEATGIAG